jgi:hypothetical protein
MQLQTLTVPLAEDIHNRFESARACPTSHLRSYRQLTSFLRNLVVTHHGDNRGPRLHSYNKHSHKVTEYGPFMNEDKCH